MTTNAQLINNALSRLGQRKSQRLREDVIVEINTAIDTLERGTFFPWFLRDTDELEAAADATFVDLPDDFALEQEETRPYYVLGGRVYYLTKRFYAQLLGEDPNDTRFYAINGNKLHFRRISTMPLTINLMYYKRLGGNLVDDDNTVNNLWLTEAHDWVVYKALSVVAGEHLSNADLQIKFAQREAKAKGELYVYHESREHQNQDYFVGGASDGS